MASASWSGWRSAVASLLLLVTTGAAPGDLRAETPTERREHAVIRARAGQIDEAAQALRDMLAAGIEDDVVAMDLTTLLQQQGKSAEAPAVFARAGNS